MWDRESLLEKGPRVGVALRPVSLEQSDRCVHELSALINTASEVTWVDLPRMNQLRLKPRDQASIPWFTGEPVEVWIYKVRLEVLANEGFVAHDMVEVYAAPLSVMRCDVILGRGLLQEYEFHYIGPEGKFTLRHLKPS